ncbi:MAG: hypothetical protein KC912_26355 [Proteobacteria bacterium]|nr:hypothetical protein [Pseudomonadota bacterium]
MVLLFALACAPPLLPDVAVAGLGHQMCALGHPKADCGEGRVVAQSHGPMSLDKTKERWVDVAIPYTRKDEAHAMTVRILVKDLVPCSVSTRVLEDDGPKPLLLGNPISSKLVGDAICRELSP